MGAERFAVVFTDGRRPGIGKVGNELAGAVHEGRHPVALAEKPQVRPRAAGQIIGSVSIDHGLPETAIIQRSLDGCRTGRFIGGAQGHEAEFVLVLLRACEYQRSIDGQFLHRRR